MYQKEISHTAHHQLRKLSATNRQRINNAIEQLSDDPRPPGVKKLKGEDGKDIYRIRVGIYRILYRVDDAARLISIYRIMPRENAY